MNITEKLTKEYIRQRLPERPKDANKGTFGKILVIAGSENFPGAAYLTCAAAYRVGVGLVTLATIPSVKLIVSKQLPEVTFILPEDIVDEIRKYNALVIGPGLGQGQSVADKVKSLLKLKILPKVVIDGDGLNIIAKIDDWWEHIKTEMIFTPHPGEMARLTKLSITEVQKDRIDIAKKYAEKWNKVVVLKGAKTIIASPEGKIVISPFANPLLATAGTGDVLSGIIAGLVAQGINLFDAACVGVYLHGMAGEKLRKKIGNAGGLASDLLPLLPQAINKLA